MNERTWLNGPGGKSVMELVALEESHRTDSIIAAIEEALQGRPELNSQESVVVAVESMEREVNNGGYEQFFTNSSCEHAAILVSAREAIGATTTAAITRRALNALGALSNWSADQFEAAATDATDDVLEELNACDDAYYGAGEAIHELLLEYIKANVDHIRI